jgi:hypothetical protein
MIIAISIKGISLSSTSSTIQSASKYLVLMLGSQRNPNVADMSLGCDLGHIHELIKSFGKIVQKIKQFFYSFPLEVMYFLLLLVWFFWLIDMTMHARDYGSKEMNVYINNIIVFFTIVGQFFVLH